MTEETFRGQKDPNRPLSFVGLIHERGWLDAWNEAFDVDYFAFRDALQEISLATHRQVPDTEVTIGIGDLGWLDEPGDEWIFPIDDDDVFAPDMADLIGEVSTTDALILRPQNYVFNPRDAPGALSVQENFFVMFTNNWGVKKSFLREHLTDDQIRVVIARHVDATVLLAEVLGREPVYSKKEWLRTDLRGTHVNSGDVAFSLSVKHPGASTAMRLLLRDAEPHEHVSRLRNAMSAMTEPQDSDSVEWAAPAIARYQDLARACLG